jgi:hypothetical protein
MAVLMPGLSRNIRTSSWCSSPEPPIRRIPCQVRTVSDAVDTVQQREEKEKDAPRGKSVRPGHPGASGAWRVSATTAEVEHWRWDAHWYLVALYQDAGGGFFTAETRLGRGDWIIVDAPSTAEAVQQMRVALPGAVESRAVVG